MRTLIILLSALMIIPINALATVEEDAAALEAEMDKVKPELDNAETTDAQYALVEKSRELVKKSLASKTLDSKGVLAVARILARNFGYDGANEVAEFNFKLINKYIAQLDQAFNQLEREKAFDAQTMQGVRASIGIAGQVHQYGNDPGAPTKRAPNKTLAPKEKGKAKPK